ADMDKSLLLLLGVLPFVLFQGVGGNYCTGHLQTKNMEAKTSETINFSPSFDLAYFNRDPLSLRLPYSLAQIIEIIQCRMCHLQFPGEKCSRGRGICTATMEEACTTGRIFRNNGTPWLTFRGCLKNCANVNNIMEGLSGKLQVLQKTSGVMSDRPRVKQIIGFEELKPLAELWAGFRELKLIPDCPPETYILKPVA
ncbi:hypothetical protein EI555_018671, partial [Monodon monoceros]